MAHIELGRFLGSTTDSVTAVQGAAGSAAWLTAEQNQLVPTEFDFIGITYDSPPNQDDPVTVVYRVGGSGGTIVATLTLTYDANRNISSVTRT